MPKTATIESEIQAVIARELGRNPDEINLETDLSDLNDTQITELVIMLEVELGIGVPDSTLERLLGPWMTEFGINPQPRAVKVDDLVAIVREQLSSDPRVASVPVS